MRIPPVLLLIGVLLAGCSSDATPPAEPAPVFKPIGNIMDLMRAITIPSSDAVFAAQGDPPKDDAGWEALQRSALMLAESGNLLMIGPRARDTGTWRKDALALIDAAASAVSAARAKNPAQLGKAADAVYTACEGCHKDYPPNK